MSALAWICGASLLSSGGAFTAAGLLAAVPEATRRGLVARTLSYAVGTLLGAAFLGLLPHALETTAPPAVSFQMSTNCCSIRLPAPPMPSNA